MSDSVNVTVQLASPVTHDGKSYSSITLRKMKAKDLVAGDLVEGENRRGFAILASVAEVPVAVIEELDIEDFAQLNEALTTLVGKRAAAAMAKAQSAAAQ